MNRDLELAIQMFRNTAARYRRYERYYKGEHDLSFATFESSMFREFAMNLCPAIVDAVRSASIGTLVDIRKNDQCQ